VEKEGRKEGGEDNCWNGDDSLRSFLFKLRNPPGVSAWKFALRAEMKQHAIWCSSGC
jgi:hypothetical protein